MVANADGSYTYTPALNYFGPVSFNYTASDGTLSASSTASLTLGHVDQAPVATPVALAQGRRTPPIPSTPPTCWPGSAMSTGRR